MAENHVRIVVAEDSADILELLFTRLTLAGYRAIPARDGFDALSAIHEHAPHGVVLDIGMPRLDGFGVLQKLKENRNGPQPPVMVLTARNRPEDVNQAISLGARDYLTKPFDDAVFLNRVARLVQKRAPAQAAPPPSPETPVPLRLETIDL